MRDYGVVYSTFWTSQTTGTLGDDGKLLALYLMTGPHSNALGCYHMPVGYIVEDLRWKPQRVRKVLIELFRNSFATTCDRGWMVIHKYLKWNPPKNPNTAKYLIRLSEQVPRDSKVWPVLINAIRRYGKHMEEEDVNRLANSSEPSPRTVSEPLSPDSEYLPDSGTDSDSGSDVDLRTKKPFKDSFGEEGTVKLTDEEHGKLLTRFGETDTVARIQRLENYVLSKGKKYVSHYRTILAWAEKDGEKKAEDHDWEGFRATLPGTGNFTAGTLAGILDRCPAPLRQKVREHYRRAFRGYEGQVDAMYDEWKTKRGAAGPSHD